MFSAILIFCQGALNVQASSASPAGTAPASRAEPQITALHAKRPDVKLDLQASVTALTPSSYQRIHVAADKAARRRLLLQPGVQDPQFSSPSPPASQPNAGAIRVYNEAELSQAISAAKGPGLTTIVLPASIILTRALPNATGPLQLLNDGSSALISCYANASAFTALTIVSDSFSMTGLTWAGCGGVLYLNGASQITVNSCSFQENGSPANIMVRNLLSLTW